MWQHRSKILVSIVLSNNKGPDETAQSADSGKLTLLSYTNLNCRRSLLLTFSPIGTASANPVESDLGCSSRFYFHNVTLTSQKPCQYNNKFDCSEINGNKILQDAINEV